MAARDFAVVSLMKINFVIGLFFALCACGTVSVTSTPERRFVEAYADWAHVAYSASVDSAIELKSAIDKFIDSPGEGTFSRAKAAWLVAREDYGKTEAFRFYGGPIDGFDGPEGRINAWPLDESYIDRAGVSGVFVSACCGSPRGWSAKADA